MNKETILADFKLSMAGYVGNENYPIEVLKLILNSPTENGDLLEWELLWKPIVRNARKLDKILLSTPTGIRDVISEIIAVEDVIKP